MESVEDVGVAKWMQLIKLLDRKQRRVLREVGEAKETWGPEISKQRTAIKEIGGAVSELVGVVRGRSTGVVAVHLSARRL